MTDAADPANGYESAADEFMRRRESSTIGVSTVRQWATALPRGGSVLDLGCGSGAPIAESVFHDGFELFGIDASPTLAAAFSRRLPLATVACESIEESRLFDRQFDGVLAVGLLFLLPADSQRALIRKVAGALKAGGRFLFTAPSQECTWTDVLSGRESRSLGAEAYRTLLSASELGLVGESEDEGGNHYYEAIAR